MPLNPSDIIRELPLGNGVKVLASHPEGIVAFEKPCGILSHPNQEADRRRSLLAACWSEDRERYLWTEGRLTRRLYLLHRLDSATSGVLLGCINPNLARELKAQFSKRKVRKSYVAVVAGIARDADIHWRDLLRKQKTGSRMRVDSDMRGGSPAETRIRILETKRAKPCLSLLQMLPLTGRTHQLRVQSAKRKLPIVGDATYGDFSFNREVRKALGEDRLFLHASSIRIRWEYPGGEHVFEAQSSIPEVFKQLMQLRF